MTGATDVSRNAIPSPPRSLTPSRSRWRGEGLPSCCAGAAGRPATSSTPAATGQESVEIVYLITSITPGQLGDEALSAIVRAHWGVENRLHYVRDVAFDEDRCRARTANGAAVLASVGNLVITVLRLLGYGNIAAALQDHAGHRDRPLRTLQRLS